MIDQLDLVQFAFEPISKADISLESLTTSIGRLLPLAFLPLHIKGVNPTYEISELEKKADDFLSMEPALQEVTFDCVIAISKISMHMRNAIYDENPVTRYEQHAKAQQIRDDIKSRRDYQEYLTCYIDILASRAADARMAKFEDTVGKYAIAMRAIQLELT